MQSLSRGLPAGLWACFLARPCTVQLDIRWPVDILRLQPSSSAAKHGQNGTSATCAILWYKHPQTRGSSQNYSPRVWGPLSYNWRGATARLRSCYSQNPAASLTGCPRPRSSLGRRRKRRLDLFTRHWHTIVDHYCVQGWQQCYGLQENDGLCQRWEILLSSLEVFKKTSFHQVAGQRWVHGVHLWSVIAKY